MKNIKHRPSKELYTQFLIGTQTRYSSTFLAETIENESAHDTFSRWLSTAKLQPHIVWEYAKDMVKLDRGYLIIDDTVIDKWYADEEKMGLVKWQYSGTHHKVVRGIGVVSTLWTDCHNPLFSEHITTDFRIYYPKHDGKTKNQHARDMLTLSKQRGFKPRAVIVDSGYAAVKTFELLVEYGWTFVCGLESNRLVSVIAGEHEHVADLATEEGIICHLKAFGQVKVFKLVMENTDIEYLVTNDLSLSAPDIREVYACRWQIEVYHRGIKQTTGLESCQARKQRSGRNHILCSILGFLALEKWRLEHNVSWYEAKQQLIAYAIKQYLKNPSIPLPKPST